MKAYFVSKRLAFGSAVTAPRHAEALRQLEITHVINLRASRNNKRIREFEWLWLPFKDDKKKRPRWFYKEALKFYKRAIRNRKAKIFVMCHHGICRSASLAYFFLRASGQSKVKCRALVRRARQNVVLARPYRHSSDRYLRHANPR